MSDRFQDTRRSLDQPPPPPRPRLSLWPRREGALQLAILSLTLAAALCLAVATVLLLLQTAKWPYAALIVLAGAAYLYLALRGTTRLQERREEASRSAQEGAAADGDAP